MAFGRSQTIKYLPNADDIMGCLTSLEIFEFYLGGLPRETISSPLREDTDPSFSLFHSDLHDKAFYKDFSTGESGDCLMFVMRLFNLQAKTDVFNKIASDFQLTQFQLKDSYSSSSSPLRKNSGKKLKLKSGGRLRISVTIRSWSIKDKNYWGLRYGFTITQLEYCKIFPISHYFVNGTCTVVKGIAYAFVEEKDGVQTFKIYQPYAEKEDKWINNNDYSVWELWTQLPETGNICIITSSRKDAGVIKTLFPSEFITSCALQSEGVKPKDSVVDELRSRFKEVFILYDNDFKSTVNRGRVAGAKLAEQTGFLQIEIPDGCETKDPSDYRDVFDGEALKSMILRLIKQRLRQEELKQIM
tara:strand:+ start:23 stop:1096 length:1074 start_codon:yes stop_codon:yes gene_type:complete